MPDVLASVGLNAAASLTGRSMGGICTRAKRLTHRGTAPGVDAVLEHWVVEASPLLSRKPLRRFAPSVMTLGRCTRALVQRRIGSSVRGGPRPLLHLWRAHLYRAERQKPDDLREVQEPAFVLLHD
mgnify:CR=1 FL=1